MKKLFLFFLILLFLPACASEDVFDMPSTLMRDMEMQKIIAPQDYDKTINSLKNNTKNKKNKHKFLTPNTSSEDEEIIKPSIVEENYVASLMVPTVLIYEKGIIPVGYYKVCAFKDESGNHFLRFYQSATKIADIPAFLTGDVYGEETINYVKIIPYEDKIVKVIYGSIDYNLETLMRTL